MLWPTERQGRIRLAHIDDRFADWRDELGLDPVLHPHCLRHSYVTHLIEDGFDPLFVQQQVGHRWGSTTALYTECRAATTATGYCATPSTKPSHPPSGKTVQEASSHDHAGHEASPSAPLSRPGGPGRTSARSSFTVRGRFGQLKVRGWPYGLRSGPGWGNRRKRAW